MYTPLALDACKSLSQVLFAYLSWWILSLFNFLYITKLNTVLTTLPCYERFPSDFLRIIFFSPSRFLEAIRTLGRLQNAFKHTLALVASL